MGGGTPEVQVEPLTQLANPASFRPDGDRDTRSSCSLLVLICGTAVSFRKTYQRGQAVLQSLHGQRHAPPDHVSVEVHVQVEVEVFGDTPVEGGEGARVHAVLAVHAVQPVFSAAAREMSSAPANSRKRLSALPPLAFQRKSAAQHFLVKRGTVPPFLSCLLVKTPARV